MSEGMELKYSDLVRGIPERRFVRAADVKRLVTRLNKLALIMQVSRSLMSSIDVKKLLGEILAKARVVMNADKASIFMIDEERGEIYASVTLDGSEIRLPRGSGIIGYVADSGETVNITDAYADSRFNRDNDTKTGYRTKSILCMAVHDQNGKITGALQVLNKLDGVFFTHEDEEMLSAFTAMAGICLENARAYQELAAEKDSLEIRVAERTAELAMAKAETDQILHAVEEGLFLLYKSREKYIIGASHSEALSRIFEQEELRSKNFIEAITRFLEPATIDKTSLFLELMFDPGKKQAVLLKLNPLALVKATYSGAKEKFLRFAFNRVGDTRVDHLMVTVTDISHEIRLKEQLERTEAQNRRHTELLLAILQSDPATLAEFLDDLDQDLAEASRLLNETLSADLPSRRNLLVEIFRIIHSVKGNSSLLNFQSLTELAHGIENSIDSQTSQPEIPGTLLNRLGEQIQELGGLSAELRSWLGRIAKFHTALSDEKKTDFLLRTLESALGKAAVSEGKDILLDARDFSTGLIPPEIKKPVKDILTHLVRNAAIHGIEKTTEREVAGKPRQGRVVLRSEKTAGKLLISLEDDGRGIDGDVRRIFRPGYSTHEGVSEFAGRGMGMNIVEETARRLGAEVLVETQLKRFTRFILRFN